MLRGLVRGGVQEPGAFLAVEGGGARRDHRAGQGGQRRSSDVKQQHPVIGYRAIPSGLGGPLGSLVAPALGDVEGVQGPAGEQGKVMTIPSGVCGRAGMSG